MEAIQVQLIVTETFTVAVVQLKHTMDTHAPAPNEAGVAIGMIIPNVSFSILDPVSSLKEQHQGRLALLDVHLPSVLRFFHI